MNYNNNAKWLDIKCTIVEFYRKNRWLIILLGFLLVLALLTGIFTSIKLYNLDNDIDLKGYSVYAVLDGGIYSFKFFVLRFISNLFVVALLCLFCLNKFVSVFGVVLIVYRAFLITLNCTFIIIKQGLGGLFTSIIIVFPCQLICLILLSLIFIILLKLFKSKKECGIYDRNLLSILVVLLIGLLIIDLIEVLLLLLFKPTTIYVI